MAMVIGIFILLSGMTEFQLNKMMTRIHVLEHRHNLYHIITSILRIGWLLFCGWLAIPLPLVLIGLFLLLFCNVLPYRNRSLLMNNFTMIIYLLFCSFMMLVIGCAGLLGMTFDHLMQSMMLRILIMNVAFILHNTLCFLLLRYKSTFLWNQEYDRRKVIIYTRFLFVCMLYHLVDAMILASYGSIRVSYLLLISGDLLILMLIFFFLNYNHVFIKSEQVKKEYEEREILIAQQYFEKEELQRLSEVDPLTSAYNRREICSLMQKGMQDGHRVICVFADLDGLKRINDTYGHTFGDLMLKRFADGCMKVMGEHGYLARIGGDEFLLVFFDEELEDVEQRILRLQQDLLQAEDDKEKVYFSYGISSNQDTVDDYILTADQRMYVCKKRKRSEGS